MNDTEIIQIATNWLDCNFLKRFKEIGDRYATQIAKEEKNGRQVCAQKKCY